MDIYGISNSEDGEAVGGDTCSGWAPMPYQTGGLHIIIIITTATSLAGGTPQVRGRHGGEDVVASTTTTCWRRMANDIRQGQVGVESPRARREASVPHSGKRQYQGAVKL